MVVILTLNEIKNIRLTVGIRVDGTTMKLFEVEYGKSFVGP